MFEYVKTLAANTKQCHNLEELGKLKKGKRKPRKGNLEPNYGLVYYVYSITSKVYYKRVVHEGTNFRKLKEYIHDGNVYLEINTGEM